MLLPYLTLIAGVVLSGVAAFFSVIGLTKLFAGAFWSVVVMGGVLEVSKLIAVSWLYHNWTYASKMVRGYFMVSILILMGITSMGIFGYLTRAYIDHKVTVDSTIGVDISIIKNNIESKQSEIDDYDSQIKVIDNTIQKMIDRNQTRTALSTFEKQKKNREELNEKKNNLLKEQNELRQKLIRSDAKNKEIESEIGPIKYLAEWYYGAIDEKVLDKTVRYVILIIIFVFDPLAIFLLIAFNISMKRKNEYEDMEFIEFIPRKPRSKGGKK